MGLLSTTSPLTIDPDVLRECGRPKKQWIEKFKQIVRPPLYRLLCPHKQIFECPVCGYCGPFKNKEVSRDPPTVRLDSKCLGCGALERHRLVWLVLKEVFARGAPLRCMLHLAPEDCLRPHLASIFGTYHTADLFLPNVDFREDVQAMSFADGTYDCVMISRVLAIPQDLDASVRELRRILKSRGTAIVMEIYTCNKTIEYGQMKKGRSRMIGMDLLELLARHFNRVDRYTSEHFAAKYQLVNKMRINGEVFDESPAEIRVPGVGFHDLVAVCHA